MKNLSFLAILFFSLSLVLISCSSVPASPPSLEVISHNDNVSFIAPINGGTWFDNSNGKGGNSFDLGMPNLSKLKTIDEFTVSCNSVINLNLSYSKDIESFKVYSIQCDELSKEKLVEIEHSNYTITTPSNAFEYAYLVETKWDETHSVNFIFKINCK